MDIQKVIDQALADPIFAADLAAKAGRASRARSGVSVTEALRGDEWRALLSEFAETPEELARLVPSESAGPEELNTTITTATTATTITTTTSLPCGISTTTTTTTTTGTTTTIVLQ